MSETPTASGDEKRTEREDGFDFRGDFYRFTVSAHNKDVMLIDRFTRLAPHEYFEAIAARSVDLLRGPYLLALFSTSIRAARPDWSVERIERLVLDADFEEFVIVEADEEEANELDGPPSGDSTEPTGDSSPVESSPSSTPPEASESETSSETPPSSGDPGSPPTTT